jgi:hypothetical protein
MAGIGLPAFQILEAAIVLGYWSSLYRGNLVFNAVESITLGMWSAAVLYLNVSTIWDTNFVPAMAGQWPAMVAIIFGALVYTFFWRRYVEGYRHVMALVMAVSLGITIYSATGRQFSAMLNYATPANFVIMITSVLCICMFIYNTKTERVFKYPALLALYTAGLPYYGYFAGSQLIQNSTPMVNFFIKFWAGMGKYVAIIAFVLVAIDAYRRYASKPVTVTT